MHTRLKTLRDTLAKHRRGEADLEHLYTAIEDLTENSDDLHVAFEGNPIDGFTVQGPFMSDDEAIDFASGTYHDWWVVPLQKPYDGNDLEVTPS
jgi:hypothetical protein